MTIDLNCDMGEGMPDDLALMPYISSVNIACGYHAGDEDIMKRTVENALKYGLAIGAHPGFADKINFGRTAIHLAPPDLFNLIGDQVIALQKITTGLGVKLHHVKPHGALYNMSAGDNATAAVIAAAVRAIDPSLILYGLSGSHSITAGTSAGLKTANEVFADRTYQDDGSLTPRSHPNALIVSVDDAVTQVLQMVEQKTVLSIHHKPVPIIANTICIHGDGKAAVFFAKQIHHALQQNKIGIQKN